MRQASQRIRLVHVGASSDRLVRHREHPTEPRGHARPLVRIARDQLPVDVVLERPGEQHDQAHRVGAPALDERHRLDDVALGLGHGRAVVDHLTLVHQARERLGEPDQPEVVEGLREEPAVQQVQDRVLDPPGVLVGRHPTIDVLAPERSAPRTPASSTGRSTRRSRRTCPWCRCRAGHRRRTSDTRPSTTMGGARAATLPRLEVDVVGQQHRQLLVGHRHLPARRAVHDGDRRAPVPLAAEQPVAQPERDGRLAAPLLAEPGGDLRDRRGRRSPSNGPEFTMTPSPDRPRSSRRDRAPPPPAGSPRGSAGRAPGRTRSPARRARAPP